MSLMTVTVMMMMMVLLDFTDSVRTLPAPGGLYMDSVNMRHVLKWLPLQTPCDTEPCYSVQFQGEFELTVLNGSWVNAPECQQTPHTHCDLTLDLGSDSDYNLHVRAQCGSQVSAWTSLSRAFNRRDTVLTTPEMTVTALGDALQVTFDKLPITAEVSVTVWRKGEELEATRYTLPSEQKELHIAALQEGAVYCVRAQTALSTQLSSSSSDTQCVPITGPDTAWKRPTTVTVTVIIMAGLLFAVFWSVVHCRPETCQTCFQKEALPHSLKSDRDIKIPMCPEEAEPCEQVQVVSNVERQEHQQRTERL